MNDKKKMQDKQEKWTGEFSVAGERKGSTGFKIQVSSLHYIDFFTFQKIIEKRTDPLDPAAIGTDRFNL